MLDRAAKLIDAKFKEMGETVGLNQQGRRADARRLVLTGAGRNIADQLRTMIDAAILDEERLLSRANRAVAADQQPACST